MNAPIDLPARPEPPDPSDCCGSGCVRCILDLYDEQLEAWKRAVAELQRAAPPAALEDIRQATRDI